MDIEARLRQLESHYRAALSATVAAKANHLALAGDPSTLPAAVRKARVRWQQLDLSKQTLVAEMENLEELERDLIAE
jgi:nicotinate-nucleotide pyrophosphorylase